MHHVVDEVGDENAPAGVAGDRERFPIRIVGSRRPKLPPQGDALQGKHTDAVVFGSHSCAQRDDVDAWIASRGIRQAGVADIEVGATDRDAMGIAPLASPAAFAADAWDCFEPAGARIETLERELGHVEQVDAAVGADRHVRRRTQAAEAAR